MAMAASPSAIYAYRGDVAARVGALAASSDPPFSSSNNSPRRSVILKWCVQLLGYIGDRSRFAPIKTKIRVAMQDCISFFFFLFFFQSATRKSVLIRVKHRWPRERTERTLLLASVDRTRSENYLCRILMNLPGRGEESFLPSHMSALALTTRFYRVLSSDRRRSRTIFLSMLTSR